jgi:hypothetical protein
VGPNKLDFVLTHYSSKLHVGTRYHVSALQLSTFDVTILHWKLKIWFFSKYSALFVLSNSSISLIFFFFFFGWINQLDFDVTQLAAFKILLQHPRPSPLFSSSFVQLFRTNRVNKFMMVTQVFYLPIEFSYKLICIIFFYKSVFNFLKGYVFSM